MKNKLMITALVAAFCAISSLSLSAVTLQDGVSLELATYRSANISDVCYSLSFTVPDQLSKPVSFHETLTFVWTGDEDLQIDFQGTSDQLDGTITVNDHELATDLRDEHIIVPKRCLSAGRNQIIISGRCGDKALNRHEDYLYTLFVPDHARSAFPCFDQPDLKARFSLSLTLPDGWVSISNDTQKPIPTYLFSFTAGRFQVQTTNRNGREITALYRETDSLKVAQLPIVFDQVALSLRWMEDYTGIPYPFEKYDFVVLPGYQFGGMEHPGCIQFTDWEIFLGPNPTPDEEMTRLNLIAHETSHMWFGDLVTMRWFNDVWTKEVFANFMADKISREQFPDVNHDLAFVKAHYPLAMNTDRTRGTHPIQQPLENLNKAGLLYGNIIYHKAPIMMRKLEQEKGAEALQQGLRSYLTRYAYGNATWDDLIVELDKYAPEHSAQSFSDVWVKQKGLPTITIDGTDTQDGSLEIRQHDFYGRGLVWKQGFDVSFADENGISKSTAVYMEKAQADVEGINGMTPILNSNGEGYGRFVIDPRTRPFLAEGWRTMPDDMTRYAAVLNLYENYHLSTITANTLVDILLNYLSHEKNELVASTTASCLGNLTPRLEAMQRATAERRMFDMMQSHSLQSVRQTLLRQLSLKATTPDVVDSLYGVWQDHRTTLLNNRDYMRMAYHLAIMLPERWQEILGTERTYLKTDDERKEFDFISRACNPDEMVQQQLFNDLLKVENRRVEPWARTMLALLNDPTREPLSNRYLVPGLDILEEIQRTGDIFFPGYWLSSLLEGHSSEGARQAVSGWIEAHPMLPAALMNKLLENAYWLLDRKD